MASTTNPVASRILLAVVPVPIRSKRSRRVRCVMQKVTISSFFASWAISARRGMRPLLPQLVYLLDRIGKIAGVVNDVISPASLFGHRDLGLDAALGLSLGQAIAGHQPLELHLAGRVHHQRPVDPLQARLGLKKEGDVT